MFQLVLSNKLREHLASVAEGAGEQPTVFDSFKPRTACGSEALDIWYVGTDCREMCMCPGMTSTNISYLLDRTL